MLYRSAPAPSSLLSFCAPFSRLFPHPALIGSVGIADPTRYATSATINPYSALLHNYFGQETAPFPAVHLTVDTDLTAQGSGLGVKGYSSLPLSAANPKSENCIFLPVPVAVKFAPSERAGCELALSVCRRSTGVRKNVRRVYQWVVRPGESEYMCGAGEIGVAVRDIVETEDAWFLSHLYGTRSLEGWKRWTIERYETRDAPIWGPTLCDRLSC